MRFVALAILVLAVVIAVIGWRATSHHKSCGPTAYDKLLCASAK